MDARGARWPPSPAAAGSVPPMRCRFCLSSSPESAQCQAFLNFSSPDWPSSWPEFPFTTLAPLPCLPGLIDLNRKLSMRAKLFTTDGISGHTTIDFEGSRVTEVFSQAALMATASSDQNGTKSSLLQSKKMQPATALGTSWNDVAVPLCCPCEPLSGQPASRCCFGNGRGI